MQFAVHPPQLFHDYIWCKKIFSRYGELVYKLTSSRNTIKNKNKNFRDARCVLLNAKIEQLEEI
jgi:hypothetical protein